MPLCRSLGDGLWEVRIGSRLVVLHGFIKKTQKTPAKEIDIALKRKRELD
jgi:phage-related protein